MRDFETRAELAAWLVAAGIDLSGWGAGAAKGVDDLWQEYRDGESRFDDEPPSRVVDVAQVIIRRGDRLLVELAQEMADGRRRERLRPPSEKLMAGESPRDAAARCLLEELGLVVAPGELISRGVEERAADSPSYPGLPTRYHLYTFETTAAALPDEPFARENAADGDPVRRHYWGWRLGDWQTGRLGIGN